MAKTFIDTNVLIYAHDSDAGDKCRIAGEQIRALWDSAEGVLSLQVLQAFYVNVTRKIAQPLSPAQAREIIRAYSVWVENDLDFTTVLRATELAEVYQLSYWDGQIIASAEACGAEVLLSEDLNAGQQFGSVQIVNPFLK